jgi:endonuclease/exonuclease/phosphatase (EEP) superfamily protein YafD
MTTPAVRKDTTAFKVAIEAVLPVATLHAASVATLVSVLTSTPWFLLAWVLVPVSRRHAFSNRPRRIKERGNSNKQITVVSSNVLWSNEKPKAAAEKLLSHHPDVLVMVEHTSLLATHLPEGNFLSWPIPDGVTSSEVSVWSPHAIKEVGFAGAGSRRLPIVEVTIGEQVWRVLPVHTQAPTTKRLQRAWERQLSGLSLSISRLSNIDVVCGDFNAALTHRQMRHMIKESGYSNAIAPLKAQRATWGPRGIYRLMAIDHMLVSSSVSVGTTKITRIPGSDHKAIVATLSKD